MKSMANIRLLKFEDIKKVVELEEKYLLETLGEELLASELERFDDSTDEGVRFYVITIDEKVIGYIGRSYFLKEAEVLNFVIDEAYQHQGFGQLLFDYMIKEMHNVRRITLEVRESNQKAINFYYKNGFTKIHTRKEYYKNGENALLLVKEIL